MGGKNLVGYWWVDLEVVVSVEFFFVVWWVEFIFVIDFVMDIFVEGFGESL